MSVIKLEDKIDVLAARRKWIAARQQEIKVQQSTLSEEHNALWNEDQELARAEATLKKYFGK